MDFLSDLNAAQREAATIVDGPVLILAGAGTGKTKTIVSRLAFLLAQGIDPRSTLTLTFTNKAAKEMRDRALALIENQNAPYPPELYTFHKFGLLFLRFHIARLGRAANFVIIDSDDKKRALKQICGDKFDYKFAGSAISRYKNSIVTPETARALSGANEFLKKQNEAFADIYEKYQNYLLANNLVDFDDLLLLPHAILKENDELRDQISRRYQYIMVDEYQDTNELQFQLLLLLTSAHKNLCVVGDDDQSIYGWRGANVKNILNFSDHFENTRVVKLEINYRSTAQIIKTASSLIAHNRMRHEKTLKSNQKSGDEVKFIDSIDENAETAYIAERILKLIASGENPSKIAVLYRINALSRALEEGFMRAKVPFKLVDSVGFYERAEIKDAIAYLRLAINPDDDYSARRVVNLPKRGAGEQTLEKLARAAGERSLSLTRFIETTSEAELETIAGKKASKALKLYGEAILELSTLTDNLAALIDRLEKLVGLRKYYYEKEEIDRTFNLDEFYALARNFGKENGGALNEFLSESALSSDQDAVGGDVVNLMTIHAAKGLEFDFVFVVGLEEGFFPLLGESSDIEEERRLGYVAFTRARRDLTVCAAQSRFFRGKRDMMKKSRFLGEAGLTKGRLKIEEAAHFKKGDLVRHKLFGMGRVLSAERLGGSHSSGASECKLTITFGGSQREILSNFVERV
ncbi:MAG: UvrD-helicase domain-containing protein [Helicobacteraceae bacterium]|jgi:DNA helicase-2/ATP-dependent DNA helicase PcrA|nr:UvrD-helicase domain-containing protein [Helicobacteraceae bacterium]